MSILIGIIVFFIFIWIIVKAFSSSKKEVRVRTVDPETGKERLEIREEVGGSTGKTAAQITLWIVIGIPVIILIIAALAG